MKPKPLNEFEHRLIAARIDALAAAGRGRNGAPPRGVASGERPRPGSGQLVDPPPQDPRIVELAAGANDLRRATRERRAKRTDAERGIVQRYTTVQRDQIATLSPDNRALTGFVDRSTDSRLAVGFRIKGDFEDQYTPLYRSRSQWGAGWVVVENPSVLTVSVHVNFSDYSCRYRVLDRYLGLGERRRSDTGRSYRGYPPQPWVRSRLRQHDLLAVARSSDEQSHPVDAHPRSRHSLPDRSLGRRHAHEPGQLRLRDRGLGALRPGLRGFVLGRCTRGTERRRGHFHHRRSRTALTPSRSHGERDVARRRVAGGQLFHTLRDHGVLAAHATARAEVVPRQFVSSTQENQRGRRALPSTRRPHRKTCDAAGPVGARRAG
jgi:hypothetical protein